MIILREKKLCLSRDSNHRSSDIHIPVCVSVWDCVFVCASECVCVCLREWLNVFVLVNHVHKAWLCWAKEYFGAVWKGRGGGLELSAEAIRAPVWGNWYLPFRSVFCCKHISLFYAPIEAFSACIYILFNCRIFWFSSKLRET